MSLDYFLGGGVYCKELNPRPPDVSTSIVIEAFTGSFLLALMGPGEMLLRELVTIGAFE